MKGRPPKSSGRRQRASDRPPVTIEPHGQLICIDPPEGAQVLDCLAAVRYASDGRRGGQLVAVRERLYSDWSPGAFDPLAVTGAGLEPVVECLLREAGHEVRRADPRTRPAGEPDLDGARRTGVLDEVMLELVRDCERGLIRHDPRAVDPARLIAQMALAYPDLSFAVVAAREGDVARVARRLRQYLPEVVWGTGRSTPNVQSRVIVSTPPNLGDYTGRYWSRLDERDVLVTLDAIESVGRSYLEALSYATRSRLYGLLDRAARPAPAVCNRLLAFYGLDEVDIPRHGHVAAEIVPVFARIEGGPELARDLDELTLMRRGVWRHGPRNRRIARLAAAIAGDNRGGVTRELPALSRHLDGRLRPSVAVLVEGLEHALVLAARLGDWPIVTGPQVVEAGLSRAEQELLRRLDWQGPGAPDRSIETYSGLPRLVDDPVDVLIRADAGVGLWPHEDRILVPRYQHDPTLIVVDLDDRHHPALRRRSRRRREAYQRLGHEGAFDWLARLVADHSGVTP